MTSTASGDRINYALRPAKSVERKMLRDLFYRLYPFGDVSGYQYIGFGSKYFSDFRLFHRTLHIDKMVSIESDVERIKKYQFNIPLDCIDLAPGNSTDVLSKMEFPAKFIAWLDYDTAIENFVLDDIDLLVSNAVGGSLISITLNVIPPKLANLREEFGIPDGSHPDLLRKKLEKLVAEEFVPTDIPEKKLNKAEEYSKLIRTILINRIEKTILDKNAALSEPDKWTFKQVVYFNYKDGADMSTYGWVFYQQKDEEKFNACNLSSLDFCKDDSVAWSIEIPNLTIKEIRKLQELMPLTKPINRAEVCDKTFSDSDIEAFSKIYKYFPNFYDIETA